MIWNYILNRIGAVLTYGAAFVVVFLIFIYLQKEWPEIYYGEYRDWWLFAIPFVVFGGIYLFRKLSKSPCSKVRKAIRTLETGNHFKSTKRMVPLSEVDLGRLTRFRVIAIAASGLFGLLLALLCFYFYWRDSDQTALYVAIGIVLIFSIILPLYNNVLKRPLKDGSEKMIVQGVVTKKFTERIPTIRGNRDWELKRYFIVIDDLQVKVSAPVFMHYNVGDGVEFHVLPTWGNKVLHHELLFAKEEFIERQVG